MSKNGVIFPKVPSFHSNDYPMTIMWVTAVLLARVEKLWKAVCGLHLSTSKCHGWMLMYLHKMCFCSNNQRQVQKDPFKYQSMSTIDKICVKMQGLLFLEAFFINTPGVLCCELMDKSFEQYKEDNIGVSYDVIVMINYNYRYDTCDPFVMIGNKEYELLTSVGVGNNEDGSWDGDTISRYGGYYSSW